MMRIYGCCFNNTIPNYVENKQQINVNKWNGMIMYQNASNLQKTPFYTRNMISEWLWKQHQIILYCDHLKV